MATRRRDTLAPNCRRCPRLAVHRRAVRTLHPHHHARPVAAFGPSDARLLVVGLAPGLNGANATGRPFSGDASGDLLFQALYRHGFCNQPVSRGPMDGLVLADCRVTNAVKCLPPENRPSGDEVARCRPFLVAELKQPVLVLSLGGVAHRAVIAALGLRQKDHVFAHGALHRPAGAPRLIDSYHCSRYNLNTGRLTPAMFDAVFATARHVLSSLDAGASSVP